MSNQFEAHRMSTEEFAILQEVMRDPEFFAKFIYLIHPIRGKVVFDLYPYQIALLRAFVANRFNIILKFRQAGVTELISLFCLWFAMYHDNKNIVIISIKDRVAKKVLRKIKFMYKNLPNFLKRTVVNGRTKTDIGTQAEIEFSNGSIISSIPTTEEAGRSEAVSLLVIDEAAIVRWAHRIWAAAFPTLSCARYDTPLIIRKGYTGKPQIIKLGEVCPTEKGVKDTTGDNLQTLTHRGRWRPIEFSQNKGKLETWEIVDCKGNSGGFTPKHRFYTPQGWKTLEEIVKKDLSAIMVDSKISHLEECPKTKKPKKEVLVDIPNFPNYLVSNWGVVYKRGKYGIKPVPLRLNKDGYLRVGLTNGEKRGGSNYPNCIKSKVFQKTVSRLVYESFMGPIPKGMEVDHINGERTSNYTTNLQLLTTSENQLKAHKHNLGSKVGTFTGNKLPNLKKRGRILELLEKGYTYREIANEIYPDKLQGPKFIKRMVEDRGSKLYLSKLRVIKKTQETIYDIHVEEDHSYISANGFINHNTGGRAILNSTPYGSGNLFHKIYTEALVDGNLFNPIRLYWRMHPERDDTWYKQQREILGPRKTAQEIDGDFLTSGNTVFDLSDIRSIEEELVNFPTLFTIDQHAKIYKKPKNTRQKFTLAMDIATGRANDFTAWTVLDAFGEEYASGKAKIPIDKAEKIGIKLCKMYNRALFAPESNDVGLGLATNVQVHGYKNLYFSRSLLRKKGKKRPEVKEIPGWYTTKANRPVIITELEEDIRNEGVIIKDSAFCNETYTFIYDSRNRPVALNKGTANTDEEIFDDEVYTDDSIFAKAIGNHVRKQPQNRYTTLPK